MPIVPTVARKSPKVRAAVLLIYAALILGGSTMVYPFMVMVTGSFSNRYDYGKYQALPTAMWRPDESLWKFIFDRHDFDDFIRFASIYRLDPKHPTWEALAADPGAADLYFAEERRLIETRPEAARRRFRDYNAFLATLAPDRFGVLHPETAAERFQDFLRKRYAAVVDPRAGGAGVSRRLALQALAREWGVSFEGFHRIEPFRDINHVPKWYRPQGSARYRDLYAFRETLEPRLRAVVLGQALWRRYLSGVGSIDRINRQWGSDYASRYEIPFSFEEPPVEGARGAWERFLKEWYPRRFISLDEDARREFQPRFAGYLRREFGSVDLLNASAETRFADFEDVPLAPEAPDENKVLRVQWMNFVTDVVPFDRREYWSGESAWRRFLESTYRGDLAALRAAHGADYADFRHAPLPARLADLMEYESVRSRYWLSAPWTNYRRVLEFIAVKGYALRNTLILVLLSVLSALLVNPMAAYALSRYSLRASHKILIFLLATMAFPHEVTMIPNFLMLRDLGLLNTFAALVLPGLANGFAIFLLKGFFDSLPRELYEAAAIDGASELRTFATITLPLTKPILAVIALNAFVHAYASFMWAFVVCQKQSMWTLMVWLYQFQQTHAQSPHLVMTSICVACVPTLIVFLFCQRIILRGIIIPQMK